MELLWLCCTCLLSYVSYDVSECKRDDELEQGEVVAE